MKIALTTSRSIARRLAEGVVFALIGAATLHVAGIHAEDTVVVTQERCKIILRDVVAPTGSTDSWSGACKNGLADGIGRYISRSQDACSDIWIRAVSGEIYPRDRSYFYYQAEAVNPELSSYYRVDSRTNSVQMLSDTDCSASPDCNEIQQARRNSTSAASRSAGSKAAALSCPTTQAQIYVASNPEIEAEREQRRSEWTKSWIEKVEQDVAQRTREEKQRWLAERAQARMADTSGDTLATVGSVIQGVAAARGQNSAQLKALGAALQGNTAAVISQIAQARVESSNAAGNNPTSTSCSRRTIGEGEACCRKQGGAVTRTVGSDGTEHVNCKAPNNEWGCRYRGGVLDGGDYACAVR